jgi:YbbR domain-containing protein
VQGPRQVKVKLWGVFQENQDIKPYVDLEGKKPGVYTLPVRLGAVMGALFTSVEPKMSMLLCWPPRRLLSR